MLCCEFVLLFLGGLIVVVDSVCAMIRQEVRRAIHSLLKSSDRMGVERGLGSRQCSQMVLSEVKIGNQGCSGRVWLFLVYGPLC